MTWHYIVWFSDWNRFKSWTAVLACSWVTVETSSISQCSSLFQSKVVIVLCLFEFYKYILSYNGACHDINELGSTFKCIFLLHLKCFGWPFLNTLVAWDLNGCWSQFLTLIFMYISSLSAWCHLELWVKTNSIIDVHGFQRNC